MSQQMPGTAELLGIAVGDCARLWRNTVNERLKPLGLSQAGWLALWNLAWFPEGLVQGELAERLSIEGPTLVRLLDRLERDGFVVRRAVAHDRRCKQVVLTPAAGPVVARVRAIIAELRGEIMAGIPPERLAAGLELLTLIRERLHDARQPESRAD